MHEGSRGGRLRVARPGEEDVPERVQHRRAERKRECVGAAPCVALARPDPKAEHAREGGDGTGERATVGGRPRRPPRPRGSPGARALRPGDEGALAEPAAPARRAAGATTRRPSRGRARRGSVRRASSGRRRSPSNPRRNARGRPGRSGRTAAGRSRRRPARPMPVDSGLGEARQQPAQPLLGPPHGRRVVEEPRVDPATAADRTGGRAHQHPPVGRRPDVVEEHPAVRDRLAAGPADLRDEIRHRLGEDDVVPNGVSDRLAGRQPLIHALVATTTSGTRRRPPAVLTSPGRIAVSGGAVQHDACTERRPAKRTDSGPGWMVAASGNRTPRRKTGEISDSTGTARSGTPSARPPGSRARRPRPAPAWSRPRASRLDGARRPRRAPRRPRARLPRRGRARAPARRRDGIARAATNTSRSRESRRSARSGRTRLAPPPAR